MEISGLVFVRENFQFSQGFVFSEKKWNRRRKGKCSSEYRGMLSFLVHFGQRLCFTVFFT